MSNPRFVYNALCMSSCLHRAQARVSDSDTCTALRMQCGEDLYPAIRDPSVAKNTLPQGDTVCKLEIASPQGARARLAMTGSNNMRHFMRFFFQLLYHPFAFTYDLVAWVVSFGKWNDWVLSIFPYIEGTRILELGHGPGHLQRFLRDRELQPVAIDESAQMGRLAKRRLGTDHKLARGLSQSLPYATDSFDTVICTFPSEYIFDPRTLSEVKRVLRNSGRLIVLPAAFPSNGFLKWLYKVTGESPTALDEALKERLKRPFVQAGFAVDVQIVELRSSRLIILKCDPLPSSPKSDNL